MKKLLLIAVWSLTACLEPRISVPVLGDAGLADVQAKPDVHAETVQQVDALSDIKPDAAADVNADASTCAPANCEDGNPCTEDVCATGAVCQHANLPDWTACGAGLICDGGGKCQDVKVAKGMAFIPAGTFWMGCNAVLDKNCQADESPQHKVTLSAYYMDLTETTVGQYKACVDAGGCSVPSQTQPAQWATYPGLTNNPIGFLNRTQARAYCNWRGLGYDLPTEAQWEMAARGSCEKNGSTAADPSCATVMRTFPWGEAAADCTRAVMGESAYGCGLNATSPVGFKTAGDSPYGLHDMAGNAWEWTRDWYAPYPVGVQTDPIGPDSGTFWVHRGGSFSDPAAYVRASMRFHAPPLAPPTSNLGMRCVFSPCDDGNPCTTDAQTGANTCGHTPVATGSACPGGLCNAASTCVQAPAGTAAIPAGTFWMGCNAALDKQCQADESPQHKVTLSGYFMDLTETTVAQYKACVDAGACAAPWAVLPGEKTATYPKLTNNPVNYVTWTQSQAYCKWRGAAYDLPTEAQWEMAARGSCAKNGSSDDDPGCKTAMRTYPWGEAPATCSYAVISAGGNGCGTGATWAVGSKLAGDSPYGLHDMAGNAWEWNRDWYDAAYYGVSPAKDPLNGVSAANSVVRGGSFDNLPASQRAGVRSSAAPSGAYMYALGFRCIAAP